MTIVCLILFIHIGEYAICFTDWYVDIQILFQTACVMHSYYIRSQVIPLSKIYSYFVFNLNAIIISNADNVKITGQILKGRKLTLKPVNREITDNATNMITIDIYMFFASLLL